MAKTRKTAKRKAPAKRKPAAARKRKRSKSKLTQRQRDMLGVALLGIAFFLGFVFYANQSGGAVGEPAYDGIRFTVGELGYITPLLVGAAGLLLILKEVWRPANAVLIGCGLIFLAVELALAAGTFGLGSGERIGLWNSIFFAGRGGVIGEAAFVGTSELVQPIGSHIVAICLFLAGLLLVTGASLGQVLRYFGIGLRDASLQISSATSELSTALRRSSDQKQSVEKSVRPILPPEPVDADLVVRATHVEAKPVDVFDLDEPDEIPNDPPEEVHVAVEDNRQMEPPSDDQITPQGKLRGSYTDDPDFVWNLPDPKWLTQSSGSDRPDTSNQEKVATSLIEALSHFGIEAKIVGMTSGPHITRYEIRLAPGIKVAKVAQLKDDLAYALAATDIRILAPIPGKQAVGVEVPNAKRLIVNLGDVYQSPPKDWSPLTVWLGKDVAGRAIGADLTKMPHLLVAGTTGAGKSGAINAMLSSVLLRATPHELRLVLVDPKQVELNHYEGIPHLLTPVITSPRMASNALQNLVREMEQRYALMSMARARKLEELNAIRAEAGDAPLPYILCVIDELADLMMVAPAEVEDSIIRLAQKARAVGIHLVLATQSPRVDVITGMIKANVPSRIAFSVSSQTDSRVILDQNGAESLLGQGDMLFSPVGTSKLQRIQGAYIDEAQIAKITEWWRGQGEPELDEALLDEVQAEGSSGDSDPDALDPNEDEMLGEAIRLVVEMGTASTSMLQRRLRVGYTRAGRLIDMLERRGVISGYEGSKPRQVLISEADLPRVFAMHGVEGHGEEPALSEPVLADSDSEY